MKTILAAKAFIQFNDKVLILKESSGYSDGTNKGKFDVVGGRVDSAKPIHEELLREIKEETGLNPKIISKFYEKEIIPKISGEEVKIRRIYFLAKSDIDEIVLSKDHSEGKWIDPNEYEDFVVIEDLREIFDIYNRFNQETSQVQAY